MCFEITRLREVKQFSCDVFFFQHSVMTNPTIFWTLLRSDTYQFVEDFVLFPVREKVEISFIKHMLIFVVNIRPARTFEIQLSVYSALSRLADLRNL